MSDVAEHELSITTKDVIITPEHPVRGSESAEFHRSVKRLKEDGHYSCFICGKESCGAPEPLQAHHYGCEWSEQALCDFDELKKFLLQNDIYGYSRLMQNLPITSVDDVRCLMILGQPHHTGTDHADGGTGTGIHNTVHPLWIMQRIAKKGMNPIPQDGETIEQVEQRVK